MIRCVYNDRVLTSYIYWCLDSKDRLVLTETQSTHAIWQQISSSSSCRDISMDIPDPLSPPLHKICSFRLVFRATSLIGTEILYVGSSWLSCLCSAMWGGPQEYITYELVLLLQQCSACLIRLILIVFVMGGWWPYSCCFVGCCLRDLINIARSILM